MSEPIRRTRTAPDFTIHASLSPLSQFSIARMGVYAIILTLTQLASHAVSGVPLTAEYLVLSLLGGALTAPLLSVLLRTLPLRPIARLVTVWFSLFIVQTFADLIEGAFFTTRIPTLSIFLEAAIVGLAVTFLESLTGLLLFPSTVSSLPLGPALKPYLKKRLGIVRLTVGSAAYFPVYFLFGALVSPFVIPYYTDPSLGLGLKIPDFSVLIPIELLRGFIFVLALTPIIVMVSLSRRNTFIWVAVFLYVTGAFIPFVAGTTLPWNLKFYHSLEILADSIVYGGILTYLFRQPSQGEGAF